MTWPPARPGGFPLPYVLNERDVLLGFVLGVSTPSGRPLPPSGPRPREALAKLLADALARGPCLVTFSGGRDSSAVLAAALDVARREGLPEPVPLTLRYPGAAGTDETAWQELVVGHLRPSSWEVVELAPESSQLLGPVATKSLAAHGLLWPPAIHRDTAWLERARGATVLTGEGGDEIFGPHRATPLRSLAHRLRHSPDGLGWPLLRGLAKEGAPRPLRAYLARRKLALASSLAWLRPPARQEAIDQFARLDVDEQWSWRQAIREHLEWPALVIALANRDWMGASYGARWLHPLLDRGFVDSVARAGGPLGYPGRSEAMRATFGDLLPDAVLSRTTKASFNTAFHGQATREFAQGWEGAGVDPELVDVEVLRSMWLADRVHAGTDALLQAAWLASR